MYAGLAALSPMLSSHPHTKHTPHGQPAPLIAGQLGNTPACVQACNTWTSCQRGAAGSWRDAQPHRRVQSTLGTVTALIDTRCDVPVRTKRTERPCCCRTLQRWNVSCRLSLGAELQPHQPARYTGGGNNCAAHTNASNCLCVYTRACICTAAHHSSIQRDICTSPCSAVTCNGTSAAARMRLRHAMQNDGRQL